MTSMSERDFVIFQIMRDEAEHVVNQMMRGPKSIQELDTLFIEALTFGVHRLGVIADRVSPHGRELMSQVPWLLLIDTGRALLEHYNAIDVENLWRVATDIVPAVYADLQCLIADTPETGIETNSACAVDWDVVRGRIGLSDGELAAFCGKYSLHKLLLFGSVLRDDFRLDSDVDVLAEFEPEHSYSLLDLVDSEQELSDRLGRKVDLIEIGSLNKYMRQRVLQQAMTLFTRE